MQQLRRLEIGDFVEFVPPTPRAQVVQGVPASWHIVQIQPQQEVTTVWRMHELGLELYSPIVRARIPTGRRTPQGRQVVRVAPKPMFPGYAFLASGCDVGVVEATKGVMKVMMDHATQKFIRLPHEAIMAIRTKEYDEHLRYLDEIAPRKRKPQFRTGDMVRVDVGPFADAVRRVEQADGAGRVMVLHGMVKLWLEADMVVAA